MLKRYIHKDKAKTLRIQELRRSNAATPIPNKKKYSRKIRYLWRKKLHNDKPDTLD